MHNKNKVLFLILLVGFLELLDLAKAQCGPSPVNQNKQERRNKLAVYKVTLKTYWSRARFPRHYPEWRPPAQFGKLVGRTHDPSYTLYHLGQRLSIGARQYVETGRTDGLDTGGDFSNILHSFTGSAVRQGEGISNARVFLDSNHTLISIFARINPSPDWFIGVDSFQLCVEGNWIDIITVELDPLDGGTDNGLTFMATNWPTQPQGIVYRITSYYPAHPVGSFYYPNLPRLPPIATLTFTKLWEYTLTETYHKDNKEMEFISNENILSNSGTYSLPTVRETNPNQDLNKAITEELREINPQRYRYWTSNNAQGRRLQQNTTQIRDNKAAIINSIALSYANMQHRRKQISFQQYIATTVASEPILLDQSNIVQSDKKQKQQIPFQSWIYYFTNQVNTKTQKSHIFKDIQRKVSSVTGRTTSSDSNTNNVIVTRRNVTINLIKHQHKHRTKYHRLHSNEKSSRNQLSRDCRVGEWNAWSACSRSCGVGETQRMRRIVIKPRRSGHTCPSLKETKWCGSISPCSESNVQAIKFDTYHW